MKIKPSSIEEIRQRTRSLIEDHEKSIRQFHENHFPHLFGREGRMIDWAPEAIEAAHCAMFREPYDGTTAALIGAGLDAAAAAQGIKDEEITRLREENARLREALKVAANFLDDAYTDTGRDEYKVAGFVARAAIWEGETR